MLLRVDLERPRNTPHIYVRLRKEGLWRSTHESARAHGLSASSLGALLLAEFVALSPADQSSRLNILKDEFPLEVRAPYRRGSDGDETAS